MRVLHLCGTARGAPWLVEIVQELAARGHDVTAVISPGEGNLAGALDAIGIRHLAVDHDVLIGARPLAAVVRAVRLVRLLLAERPDVLHSHLFPSNIAGRIAGWLADVPIRMSMNAGPYYLESPIFDRLDLLTAPLDTKVIASCEYTRHLYRSNGLPESRLALVYYGSRPTRFDPARADRHRLRRELGLAHDVPLIGMVAYFYPPSEPGPTVAPHLAGLGIKGHDVLLRAIPLVLAQVPNARFVLVGDGWGPQGQVYLNDMKALAASLGVDHAVTFAGQRNDVPDLLAGLDVAVQCSRSENLGGAIEALLMEAPLVVSRIGGLVDAVRHDETGLVVPSDDPPALADAIGRLVGDRALRRRLGAAGRALMLDRFTAARTGADIDALYRACAGEAGSPRPPGYRRARMFVRWLWSPVLAVRLQLALSPLLVARVRQLAGRLLIRVRG